MTAVSDQRMALFEQELLDRNGSRNDKTKHLACALSEDSDHYSPGLIGVSAVRFEGN